MGSRERYEGHRLYRKMGEEDKRIEQKRRRQADGTQKMLKDSNGKERKGFR